MGKNRPKDSKSVTSQGTTSKKLDLKKRKQAHPKISESDDSEEETSAYGQLVGSLNLHKDEYLTLWKRKKLEESAKKEDNMSDSGSFNNEGKVNGSHLGDDVTKTPLKDCENLMEEDENDLYDELDKMDEDYRHEDNVDNETTFSDNDPFSLHFEQELEESVTKRFHQKDFYKQLHTQNDILGLVTEQVSSSHVTEYQESTEPKARLEELAVRPKLCETWEHLNGSFTPLQQELFKIFNSYKDLFYSNRTFQSGEEIRRLYCFHAMNHLLKTRSAVLRNNTKIQLSQKDKTFPGELRDQGLTRPKVLILVPFRDSAFRIINILSNLAVSSLGKGQIMNRKRFNEEYSEADQESSFTATTADHFKQMFAGNIDDCFRIGVSILRRGLKLYSEFYSADLIIASPLGLRTVIGTEGEKSRDYDFLSSIEILILDQSDVFLMQNWEHLQHIFDHLHLQPQDSHDVDFSRVRMWTLNGWSKLYRQTLIFSSFITPEINSLFNRSCHNYAGKVKTSLREIPGSVCKVVLQIPQVFQRVDCQSFSDVPEKRFQFFINKILPEFQGRFSGHTAIFIPSYFDFVRIRNYFKKEEIHFVQISEYSKRSNISRSRTSFFHGEVPFLLYTERFYFFYRYRIRGIRNIIFYELPLYSEFYPEILNFMDTQSDFESTSSTSVSCTALYSKYDTHRLAGIVGLQRSRHMLKSDNNVHLIVTEDET